VTFVVRADALDTKALGPAWTEVPFPSTSAAPGFAAARWDVAPGTRTASCVHERGEAVLYVAEGEGQLLLGDGTSEPIATESVVWLEPGDEYRLQAGGHGLAVVVASTKTGGEN
jgi:quercetin dioxygenase-like cupin family protein